MKIGVNLDEVKEIKDGEYDVFIERAVLKTSTSGNRMLSLRFRVMNEETNAAVFDQVVFSVPWKVAQFLRALYGKTFGDEIPGIPDNADDGYEVEEYLGKKLRVIVDNSAGIAKVRKYLTARKEVSDHEEIIKIDEEVEVPF